MKSLLLGLALVVAPMPAFADTIANTVGNTVVVQTADGARIELRVRADGTFSRRLPDGSSADGQWTQNGNQFCETSAGARTCQTVADGKNVGDTWTEPDANGATVTISIVSGQ